MTITTDDQTDDQHEAEQILAEAGLTWSDAHAPYIWAVAAELERHGLTVTGLDHSGDDPRRGLIAIAEGAEPGGGSTLLSWTEGDAEGWTYGPRDAVNTDRTEWYADDVPVSGMAIPADVARALLAELGRDVPELPALWQPPAGYVSDFEDIDPCWDYTDPHPVLERMLAGYVGYPGADRAWPAPE